MSKNNNNRASKRKNYLRTALSERWPAMKTTSGKMMTTS